MAGLPEQAIFHWLRRARIAVKVANRDIAAVVDRTEIVVSRAAREASSMAMDSATGGHLIAGHRAHLDAHAPGLGICGRPAKGNARDNSKSQARNPECFHGSLLYCSK
jgi:hypothetical protein